MITDGTGISINGPRTLSARDTEGNIIGDELITAQLTYGSLGGCQGATLGLASDLWQGQRRDRRIDVYLSSNDGVGRVFTGVLDNATRQQGALGAITLMPPHQVYTGVLGGGLTYSGLASKQRTYGVSAPYAASHETRGAVFEQALAPHPNAELGVNPNLIAVFGRPESASPKTLDARDAISVKPLGRIVPDYATQAIFDPGDGWRKYTYSRHAPDFVQHRTISIKADPAIAEKEIELKVTPQKSFRTKSAVGETGVYDSFFGTPPANEVSQDFGGTWHFTSSTSGWFFDFDLPRRQAATSRYSRLRVRAAVNITDVQQQRKTFDWKVHNSDDSVSDKQTTEVSQDDGTVISIRLISTDGDLTGETVTFARQSFSPTTADNGVFDVLFELPNWEEQYDGSTLRVVVQITQTKGHRVEMAVQNVTAKVTESYPNTAGIIWPPQWSAPFITEPTYELEFAGWHVPPLQISGLPVGEQLAAGATVYWSRDECKTVVQTVAWPYAGQRRG